MSEGPPEGRSVKVSGSAAANLDVGRNIVICGGHVVFEGHPC